MPFARTASAVRIDQDNQLPCGPRGQQPCNLTPVGPSLSCDSFAPCPVFSSPSYGMYRKLFFFFFKAMHKYTQQTLLRAGVGLAPAVTLGLAGGSQSQDADSWRFAAAGSGRTDGRTDTHFQTFFFTNTSQLHKMLAGCWVLRFFHWNELSFISGNTSTTHLKIISRSPLSLS